MVRARRRRTATGDPRTVLPGRGDHLAEGLHRRARALRRRRYRPYPEGLRRDPVLAASTASVRRGLARAAESYRAVWLHLPGRAGADPAVGHVVFDRQATG